MKFQEDNVDITEIAICLDATITGLVRRYTIPEFFAVDTKFLLPFLEKSRNGYLEYEDGSGGIHRHELLYTAMPMPNSRMRRSKETRRFVVDVNDDGSLAHCKEFAKVFVLKIIDGLKSCFPDMSLFQAIKIFNPNFFLEDMVLRYRMTSQHLEDLSLQLGSSTQGHVINFASCKMELYTFIDTLWSTCRGLNFKESWLLVEEQEQFRSLFSNMIRLWQFNHVLPINTACCERGFSLQNLIKTKDRSRLLVGTVRDLMMVNLSKKRVIEVDWNRVWDLWNAEKNRLPCQRR